LLQFVTLAKSNSGSGVLENVEAN